MNQIALLRDYLKDALDPEITEMMFFETKDLAGNDRVGVLYCDPDVERLDQHCDQCQDEVLGFKLRLKLEGLSSYLSVGVGPTKYARIRAGWRDSQGIDLRTMRFVP